MADQSDPARRWAATRRQPPVGLGRSARIGAAVLTVGGLALMATLLWPPRPRLVWNASASSPVGLYAIAAPGAPRPGDMVIAWPPAGARRLGAQRHYLPANVPLVKRVAAAGGDRVCARGDAVAVNGRVVALRRRRDRLGRPLPRWSGCGNLAGGDLFLLTPDVAAAFDGRYFGITRRRHVIGRARLLWPR